MALPSSGQLAFSAIRQELTIAGYVGSYSLDAMSGMAGKFAPHATSEFYGYSSAPAETMDNFFGFYNVFYNGYNYTCTEQIIVGYSSLGKYYEGSGFSSPLNGYYGDETGIVYYYSNGYRYWSNGMCNFW